MKNSYFNNEFCSFLGQGLGSRGGVAPPSAERILGHMERIRSRGTCPVMFRAEGMQKALQIAQAACTDTQRMLFSNLFQLLDEDEPHTPSTNKNSTGGKGRGRKAAPTFGNSNKKNAKSVIKGILETSEESSEVSHDLQTECNWFYNDLILFLFFQGRGSYKTKTNKKTKKNKRCCIR